MAELKTRPNDADVGDYLEQIADPGRRTDAKVVCAMLTEVTGEQPKMWGKSMVGFGTYRYRYASGREGDWLRVGFAARKVNLTVYLSTQLTTFQRELDQLGPHTTGMGCLYIKRLADIDLNVLRRLVKRAYQHNVDAA